MIQCRSFFFILSVIGLVAASCTKPILLGSDFLEDEKAFLDFQDTFDLKFYTERTDSIIVHSGKNISLQLITYMLGDITDPIFGRYKAEIYAQPILPRVATELIGSTLDSVVLQLRYDTLGNYGSLTEPVTLEVFRMIENPRFDKDYYSKQRFVTETESLGSITFVPHPFDSLTVNEPDTQRVAPHIRIPLSRIKLAALLAVDSTAFSNFDTFLHFFNGLHIKMTGAGNTMLGIDLLNSVSGLSFYYDKGTLLDREFKFLFTSASVKTVYMEHDYTGSFVEPSLAPEEENDYWFVQGLSGVTTKMTIEDLPKLGTAIINQAELEVYCSFPAGDLPHFYPPVLYLVTQEKTDTSFINSLDVAFALSRTAGDPTTTGYQTLYGGKAEKISIGPPAVYRYNMKVTSQVKDIFLGKKENVLYFNPFDKGNVPNRSVMFGPGHPEYAPRLRIYYTAL